MITIDTFKASNVEFMFDSIEVFTKEDAEAYVKNFFEKIGYTVERSRRFKGVPDFYVFKEGTKFYVEVKTNGDGLREEQARWIVKNPEKKVIVFFLHQEIEAKKEAREKEKMEKERNKQKQEKENLKRLSEVAQGIIN